MLFFISKILWFFVEPSNLILLILLIGGVLLWTRWRRTGRWFVSVALGLALLVFFVPFGEWALRPLEDRFPIMRTLPERVDGVILLGGSHRAKIAATRGQPSLSAAAERSTTFLALARRYPEARLVVTAGSGSAFDQSTKEASSVRMFFDQMGFDAGRATIIEDSRNTYEAAKLSMARMAPAPGETWLLITSAAHMPRSVGLFRKLGWPVVAYPVDYETTGGKGLTKSFKFDDRLKMVSHAMKEWVGLTAYYLMGRTSAWFPGPGDSVPPP